MWLLKKLFTILFCSAFILINIGQSKGEDTLSTPKEFLPLFGEQISYKVEKGEGLFEIAKKFGVSFLSIARANQIQNPNLIREGEILVLPTQMIVPKIINEGIIINVPEYRLYFFKDKKLFRVYSLCIGLPTWETPIGEFQVIHLIKNPTWYMPEALAKVERVKREVVPPGPMNPLGDRWMGTDLRHFGIHSTNQPMSIGKALSHGCVRLYPGDAHELFDLIEKGTKGETIYEPVKVTLNQDKIYLEVHPDVYGRKDLKEEILKKLTGLELVSCVEENKIKTALDQKLGIPQVIGETNKVKSGE